VWGVLANQKKGVYAPVSFEDLQVLGADLDYHKEYALLSFVPCLHSEDSTCADPELLAQFLAEHFFYFFHLDSFVEMDKVKAGDQL